MAKPKVKLLICKSENCLSCIHKVTDRVDEGEDGEDELEVICDIEMDATEDEELEVCPQYSAIAPTGEDYAGDDYRLQRIARKDYSGDDDKPRRDQKEEVEEIMESKTAHYIFVGNSLSQVEKKRSTSVTLPIDFAENYNRKVQEAKSALEQQIESLKGDVQTLLADVEEQIKSGVVDTSDPSSLDDLFEPELLDEDFDDEDSEEDFEDEDD